MRRINRNPVFNFLFLLFLHHFLVGSCISINTITQKQSIRDGESLVTVDEIFELGFFSPENSSLRYLGIWYKKIDPRTIIWVANREKPITDNNGVLRIAKDGNLVLLDGGNGNVWSTNARTESNSTVAILKESGNLVLSDSDTSKPYWESFNLPTDTYLPGMRVRVNAAMGENPAFVSWNSENDPSPGRYSMGVDPGGAPQIVIWEGQKRIWRSGQWNSVIFTGVPNMSHTTNYLFGFKLSSPPEPDGSVYFTYVPSESSDILRFRIRFDGIEEQFRWDEESKKWTLIQSQPANECENYNHCGNFGFCNNNNDDDRIDSNKCSCMNGFEPRFPGQWSGGNFSGGCERKVPLKCQRNNESRLGIKEDGFKGLKCMKLPDFGSVISPEDSETCREICLKNCSCNAYADASGIGCIIWTDELIDIQRFANGGSLLFIRLADSELGGKKEISNLVIVVGVVVGAFLLGISIWLLWRSKNKLKVFFQEKKDILISEGNRSREYSTEFSGSGNNIVEGNQVDVPELPIFSFNSVAVATNNFSEENKLGKGGFGTVYKGELPGGQEIAVKRLSGKSGQGLEEFKNEIILIAKLQHRNLVRLLGCCIQGEEKMLLYEYMPNKSLDCFLFEETKQSILDWNRRFIIIEGIARGLLYLHRDSRLRIIHRDLKASNILLDADMIPKISDFGMARIFGGNQKEANTVRVVGTFGYMSPEYAMTGLFSVKSDVYSFGVLLLEIVSGRRNASFRQSDHGSLIGYAWYLWSKGSAMELVDPTVRDSCTRNEVLRCIHVGMLCVQDSTLQRPDMASVVLMLGSEAPKLPLPRQPTFNSMRSSIDMEFNLDGQDVASVNDLTVTAVVAR